MSMNPMQNFDGPSQEVMMMSYRILRQGKQNQLDVEHLLLALLLQPGGFAEYALEQCKVDRNLVMARVEEKLAELPQSSSSDSGTTMYIVPRLQQVLTRANNFRAEHHSDLITPRDLLLAVVENPGEAAAILLKRFGLDYERLANVRPDSLEESPPANVTTPTIPAESVETSPLTHFNEEGRARMVDVSEKEITERRAVARGEVQMLPETLTLIREGRAKKGMCWRWRRWPGLWQPKRPGRLFRCATP